MGREIAYYFTLGSPWAYLGYPLLTEIAARHGAAILYRPMPVRRVFDETGGLPLPRRHPVRQLYRLVELQRWRERRGLPLNLAPRHAPFDATLADGCVAALLAAGRDPGPFIRAAGAGFWAEDRNLAEPETIAAVLGEAGTSDPGQVLKAARAEAAIGLYEANFAAALEAGVFGAPTYSLDGELFWGQDRLELLGEALRSGRPAYRPD
ncbi:2-hydroxychromene-2-carboxylate isomerase [uncultured Enterovirga sp.]|uniref:2-hydroxychromene-2-carboxylate isomerase n=1 Tax=uncultured Enterovirga sp. TaxID=2026352 RepID=UPI0035CC908C